MPTVNELFSYDFIFLHLHNSHHCNGWDFFSLFVAEVSKKMMHFHNFLLYSLPQQVRASALPPKCNNHTRCSPHVSDWIWIWIKDIGRFPSPSSYINRTSVIFSKIRKRMEIENEENKIKEYCEEEKHLKKNVTLWDY